MASLDPFEPIREGLKDLRDVYKTNRTLDIEEGKAATDREEKRLKRKKEAAQEEARAKLEEQVRTNPGNVFADPEGAALAIRAGISPSVFRNQIDRSGITYPGGQSVGGVGAATTDASGEPTSLREDIYAQPNEESYSFDKGVDLQNLKNVAGRIQSQIGQAVSSLPNTTSDKRGIDAQIQAGTAQLKGINRAISNYQTINDNLNDALKVFKSEEGQVVFDKAMAKYNKDIVPILQSAGVPAAGIKQQTENAIVNFANDWKLDKDAVNSLFNTYMSRAAVADDNFNDPKTQEVLRYAKDMDVDTLKKVIQDERMDPFHKNLLGNILRTKFFQDEASSFLQKTTGAIKEFVPISDDQIDNLYKMVKAPVPTEYFNPAEAIRGKAQDLKTEAEKEKEMKSKKPSKSKKSYQE